MENKRVKPNNVYTKKRNSMPNNAPKDFDIGNGSYDLYSDIVFDDEYGTHSYSDMWIGCINCPIGDTRLEEAFITKDNIKQISKSSNDNKPFMFMPAHPAKQLMFSDIKEFESYDELFEYFNTEGEGLKWTPAVFKYFRNDGARIILMVTTEHGVGKRMIKGLPAEYEDAFSSCYKLDLSIRYNKKGNKGHTVEDFFVGYVNCSIDEMGYYKKK